MYARKTKKKTKQQKKKKNVRSKREWWERGEITKKYDGMWLLTHIYPVDFSILINWRIQFLNLGVSGVLLHMYLI